MEEGCPSVFGVIAHINIKGCKFFLLFFLFLYILEWK